MSESTLTEQQIVVIGGSSGMGLATAHAAAAAGAAVTIASSSKERLNTALAGLPDGCDGVVTDLHSEDDVIALFEHVGELDHLVFTAGDAAPPGRLQDTPLAAARALFDVRLWGAITAVKYAAPRIRPGGSIALTSGTIGVRPAPGRALAAASATAVEGLVRGLAVELAPIRVNAIRSGTVRTPMWDGIPEPQRTELFATLAQRTLTGTIGEPEQIAAAHLHLMQNSFVTGTILTVDGGLLLA
ncbi:SDR family oxidoreductase [Nocardia sp. CA2R105]|uniref:SDR family oxidoreductase n=1 Tax=Nocardia coffeae TaxID=2873381 RepID=UPI001CA60445|nr:SDR family oxidoreductase [Nocardia coffeae]MBY8862704.1 SDR family oxidoreductase [Nocardia coffeae]